MIARSVLRPLTALLAFALAAHAQDAAPLEGTVSQVSTHMGEMVVDLDRAEAAMDDPLRFEPFQQLDQMFGRDDVVFVMRHGPTDWSKLDRANVDPTDCANQRVMTEDGKARMRHLGTLIASNDILPSRIVVSQWCRNQQTVAALLEGIAEVDPAIADEMPVATDPALNLLLSLRGARDVTGLRDHVTGWDGDPGREGPLLLITHYTDIEELTQFRVFEGEILVLDPKRDNLVLGYLRLRSAAPDVGHFADALNSPLVGDEVAVDMVARYYDALNAGDEGMLDAVLASRWVARGASPSLPDQGAAGFLEELAAYTDGLSDGTFTTDEVHVAGGVVTVIGTITGRHTAELFGVPATGREVAFGSIAVHRVEDGAIVETRQMADTQTLLRQIGAVP